MATNKSIESSNRIFRHIFCMDCWPASGLTSGGELLAPNLTFHSPFPFIFSFMRRLHLLALHCIAALLDCLLVIFVWVGHMHHFLLLDRHGPQAIRAAPIAATRDRADTQPDTVIPTAQCLPRALSIGLSSALARGRGRSQYSDIPARPQSKARPCPVKRWNTTTL